MTLQELIDALAKAPPECLGHDVMIHIEDRDRPSRGCVSPHFVEALNWKPTGWGVVIGHMELFGKGLIPPDENRIYLNDITGLPMRNDE